MMRIVPFSLPLCSFLSSAWCAPSWSLESWTVLSSHREKKTDKECCRTKSYKVLGCEIFIWQEVFTTWTRNLTGNPPRVSPSAPGSLFLHGDWLMRGSLSYYYRKKKQTMKSFFFIIYWKSSALTLQTSSVLAVWYPMVKYWQCDDTHICHWIYVDSTMRTGVVADG